MTMLCRKEQRRLPLAVDQVGAASGDEQRTHDGEVTLLGRVHERGEALRDRYIPLHAVTYHHITVTLRLHYRYTTVMGITTAGPLHTVTYRHITVRLPSHYRQIAVALPLQAENALLRAQSTASEATRYGAVDEQLRRGRGEGKGL